MYYVYVLKSKKDDKLYIGSTTDLKKRFQEHNSGKVESTKPRRPFVLVYYEAYGAEEDARIREDRLKKRGQSRAQLMLRLQHTLSHSSRE